MPMPDTAEHDRRAYLKSYLGGMPPESIRSFVISSLIVPVLFLSFGSFVSPFIPFIFYFLTSGTIVFFFWGLCIGIAPFRAQRIYFLYVGLLSAFTSLGLLTVSIKLVYYTMRVREMWYPCFLIAGYLILAFLLRRWHLKALYTGAYSKTQTKRARALNVKKAGWVGLGTGVGMVGSQFFLAQSPSFDASMSVLACLMLLLGLIFLLVTHNVHKYILMGRYPELASYIEKPSIPKKENTKSRRRTQ